MTTAVQENTHLLKSEKDLEHYFHGFIKPQEAMKVGLEAEFFCADRQTGKAVPYEGMHGVEAVLKALARKFRYETILENGRLIGLTRNDSSISLEPGGQVELSAPPVHDVFEIEGQLRTFIGELEEISHEFKDIAWLASGIQPFSALDEISWVPKTRYKLMAEHFRSRGLLSHHMMKRTATNQVNIDYTSEENAMAIMRTALGLSSVVSAMFANSSFSEGKLNGYKTYRMEIWRHTDPDRSGLIMDLVQPGRKFKDYLEYVLNIPLIFVVRSGQMTPLPGLTFREYLKNGHQGLKPTLGDFELHLSTIFPEVRIKQYIEVRGADCQSPDMIPAVAAFWKGLLYDAATREKAWGLVKDASPREREKLYQDIPKEGLSARLGGEPIFAIAEQLVELSCESLGRQKREGQPGSECVFLSRIREKIIRTRKSPGEILEDKWEGELCRDPKKLIQYLSIIPGPRLPKC